MKHFATTFKDFRTARTFSQVLFRESGLTANWLDTTVCVSYRTNEERQRIAEIRALFI